MHLMYEIYNKKFDMKETYFPIMDQTKSFLVQEELEYICN